MKFNFKISKEYRKPVLIILSFIFAFTIFRAIYYFFFIEESDLVKFLQAVLSPLLMSYIIYAIAKLIKEFIENKNTLERISDDKLSRTEEMLLSAQKIANIGYWEEHLISGEINFSDELFNILDLDGIGEAANKKEQLTFLHSDEKNEYHIKNDDLFNYGQIELDYKLTTKKGNTKYLFERISLIKQNGAPHKLVGAVQDISERKLSEQKTFQSEQYYKSLFDGAKDAIILFYPENAVVIDVNQRACEMYGFSKSELIGMSLFSVSKDPERGRVKIENTLKEKQFYNFKSVHFKKDGSEIELEITTSVIDYFGEKVIMCINRDVTETNRAEEKIRLLSLGIEQHPASIVITDINANIEYVNHAFELITGYTFEEVKGKNPRILQSGETKKEVYTDLWNTLKAGKEWRGEFLNKKKDGTLYWELEVIYPVIDSNNKIKEYFASKLDITKRKELEYQLELYRDRLEFLVDERTKRLKESEEAFRALSENSNDVIMRFNNRIEHLYVNPAAEKIFNLAAVNFVGKSYSELNFAGAIFTEWEEAIRKVFETKNEYMIEISSPDGRWFDCRLYPEFNNEGEVVSVITASRDITQAKLTEKDLYRKERLLRGVAEASNKLLALDSFYKRINQALEIMGKAVEIDRIYIFENSRESKTKDLVMSQLYEWVAPGVSKQIDNPKLQKLSYKKAGFGAESETLSGGQAFSFLVKDIPLQNRKLFEEQNVQSVLIMPIEIGGVFWGFVGLDECKYERIWTESEISILKILASDIGGAFTRKLIEDALMNTEERFKALFDYAPIGYFIVDPDGFFIDVNNSLEKKFGYSKKEIADRKKIQNFIHSKEDKAILEKVLATSHSGIPSEAVELTMFHKDGKKIIIELNTFPIILAEKRMVLCAVHDVSLRKETENEIRTALSHSQELNEIKSRFVSMVSHEFRTPLSTILSSVEILKLFESRLKEDEKENHYKKIAKSIDYLTNLLDDVITINRADSGRLSIKYKSVEIIPLLEQWIQDIKASFAETPEIIFEKRDKDIKVELDENQFRQIVSNLLNNAIKYTPANKKIKISVSSDNGNLVLQIADQGIGIPIDAQSEIFNPFFRAVNTGKVPGSGLGLAVTMRSIESLSGQITFESKENKGTTFTVIIPLKRGRHEKNITN